MERVAQGRARSEAQAFGDAILAALSAREGTERATALDAVAAPGPGGAAVVDLLASAERSEADTPEAARRLLELADTPDTPAIYRRLATLKAVALPGSGLSAEARRARLAPLASQPGLVRLLAEEQLAMIDLETGARGAALDRLSALAADAEATPPLRRRVAQVIVALGEETAPTCRARPARQGSDNEPGPGAKDTGAKRQMRAAVLTSKTVLIGMAAALALVACGKNEPILPGEREISAACCRARRAARRPARSRSTAWCRCACPRRWPTRTGRSAPARR